MNSLTLIALNDLIYRVLTLEGEHVGNLKRIGGVWKFKALGIDDDGSVVPGGGPLTHQHNMVFSTPLESEVSAGLLVLR